MPVLLRERSLRLPRAICATAGSCALAMSGTGTAGNNTVTFTQTGSRHIATGFTATRGYDLASGAGTIHAPQFVYELANK